MTIEHDNLLELSYEDLANALYRKGLLDGYKKITDKTKWREAVTAEKLGHTAHKAISAGKYSEKYGSDAYDEKNVIFAEYKTQAIEDPQLRNLLEKTKNKNKGTKFVPLVVNGVYNGAYTEDAILDYSKIDHYFAVFYRERCCLIIKPKTEEVIRQLSCGLNKMNENRKLGKKVTTNCNSVTISLKNTDLYTIVHKDYSTIQ